MSEYLTEEHEHLPSEPEAADDAITRADVLKRAYDVFGNPQKS